MSVLASASMFHRQRHNILNWFTIALVSSIISEIPVAFVRYVCKNSQSKKQKSVFGANQKPKVEEEEKPEEKEDVPRPLRHVGKRNALRLSISSVQFNSDQQLLPMNQFAVPDSSDVSSEASKNSEFTPSLNGSESLKVAEFLSETTLSDRPDEMSIEDKCSTIYTGSSTSECYEFRSKSGSSNNPNSAIGSISGGQKSNQCSVTALRELSPPARFNAYKPNKHSDFQELSRNHKISREPSLEDEFSAKMCIPRSVSWSFSDEKSPENCRELQNCSVSRMSPKKK
eukprot:976206_1